jgi:hypothetical protein
MTNSPVNSVAVGSSTGPIKKGVYSSEIATGVQRILRLYFADLSGGFSTAMLKPRRVWPVASSKHIFSMKHTSYPQLFPQKNISFYFHGKHT